MLLAWMILQESFKYVQAVSDLGRNEHRVSDARYLRREKFLYTREVRNLKWRQTTTARYQRYWCERVALFVSFLRIRLLKWLFSVISACFLDRISHRGFEKAYKCGNPRSDPIYCSCGTYVRYSSRYHSWNKFRNERKLGRTHWKIARWNICRCMFICKIISFWYRYIYLESIEWKCNSQFSCSVEKLSYEVYIVSNCIRRIRSLNAETIL